MNFEKFQMDLQRINRQTENQQMTNQKTIQSLKVTNHQKPITQCFFYFSICAFRIN